MIFVALSTSTDTELSGAVEMIPSSEISVDVDVIPSSEKTGGVEVTADIDVLLASASDEVTDIVTVTVVVLPIRFLAFDELVQVVPSKSD